MVVVVVVLSSQIALLFTSSLYVACRQVAEGAPLPLLLPSWDFPQRCGMFPQRFLALNVDSIPWNLGFIGKCVFTLYVTSDNNEHEKWGLLSLFQAKCPMENEANHKCRGLQSNGDQKYFSINFLAYLENKGILLRVYNTTKMVFPSRRITPFLRQFSPCCML